MKKSLEQLSPEELSGLVNIYPWFSAARMMLARKLIEAGGWSRDELGQALLHISDPAILRPLAKALIVPDEMPAPKTSSRKRVAGGDFFSREEYDKVRFEDDDFFKKPMGRPGNEKQEKQEKQEKRKEEEISSLVFITETLAQIYAEQGYIAQAKDIYEKLILAYPKKSAYFAALIEKLNN